MTIEESKVENFPFKIGDRVMVRWRSRNGIRKEKATISQMHTSEQCGVNVVHAIMIRPDNHDKDVAVCQSIIEKITDNNNTQLKLKL